MEEMITAREAAERLGVSRQWVLRLCLDGRIPAARRVGRQWELPAGADIEILPPPTRPSRTIEIPRADGKRKTR
jgi:excisionase family DNA binding protein